MVAMILIRIHSLFFKIYTPRIRKTKKIEERQKCRQLKMPTSGTKKQSRTKI
jgi:hypothetical protein